MGAHVLSLAGAPCSLSVKEPFSLGFDIKRDPAQPFVD